MNNKFFDVIDYSPESSCRLGNGPLPEKPLSSIRVTAIDIYMLCPQHDLFFQGADVDRLINWVSALSTDVHGSAWMDNCPDRE
jgi:hypothetical protein